MRHIKAHQTDATSSKEVINELKENPHIMGNLIADKLADYKRHKILLESDKLI